MAQRIVDLTLTISDNMPVQAAFQRPVYVTLQTHESSLAMGSGTPDDPHTSSWKYLGMVEHTGTHVDAFFHMNPNGLTIDRMPLEMFFGKAVCFDMTHVPDLGEITVEDLEEAQRRTGITVDGHIVLLNTGFHRRHYPDPHLFDVNPGLSVEATHWLADHGSVIHGVEGPSTDIMSTNLFPSHRVCRDRGITHYEWLVNLEELVGKGEFVFYGVPLRLDAGTGSPVRAFAIVEE
ncbi:kynurenine formamidase [Salana multivorans]|uniref:Kynurenine formamidase n=1 Tax=Salana multivorans TaxID=120377 RepID=A0A3N2D953_9MICO|nr:cyclase family protein [Salana multivorans]ROR96222.1 kynurenine formamidase [Salana multivorans]